MREIKFRAWFPNFKRFLRDYEKESHLMDILNGKLVCNVEEVNSFSGNLEYYKDTGYILQQYTGLKDKNGVEIYEGDIVKTRFGRSVIWWNEELCRFGIRHAQVQVKWIMNISALEEYEIMGNIYENPELLKKTI